MNHFSANLNQVPYELASNLDQKRNAGWRKLKPFWRLRASFDYQPGHNLLREQRLRVLDLWGFGFEGFF